MQFKLNPVFAVALLAGSTLLAFSPFAHANGGHFLVDDADITPRGECAVETFVQRFAGTSGVATAGLCTTQSGWEIGVPVTYNLSDNELSTYGLELKTIATDNLWGGALAISVGVERDNEANAYSGGFINLPYSRSLSSDVVLHVNIGSAYSHAERDWQATWGVASTFTLNEQLDVIAETAGVGSDKPTFAIGFRSAFADRFEFDASVGRDLEQRGNVVTLGLNIAF